MKKPGTLLIRTAICMSKVHGVSVAIYNLYRPANRATVTIFLEVSSCSLRFPPLDSECTLDRRRTRFGVESQRSEQDSTSLDTNAGRNLFDRVRHIADYYGQSSRQPTERTNVIGR